MRKSLDFILWVSRGLLKTFKEGDYHDQISIFWQLECRGEMKDDKDWSQRDPLVSPTEPRFSPLLHDSQTLEL